MFRPSSSWRQLACLPEQFLAQRLTHEEAQSVTQVIDQRSKQGNDAVTPCLKQNAKSAGGPKSELASNASRGGLIHKHHARADLQRKDDGLRLAKVKDGL